MIGAFGPAYLHRCQRVLGEVSLFVNTTDFVDDLAPIFLWIIVTTRHGGGMHISRVYLSPRTR